MPTVTYNGQSFALDGKKHWILGASIHYARHEPASWADRIADARDAGFNTIETPCPWSHHEPRRDRFDFTGDLEVAKFIETCAAMGMKVVLRPGPFIGDGYDGGGLPAWLSEVAGLRVRETNEHFLERVITWYRQLFERLVDLQATRGGRGGGPIVLVGVEHGWLCSNGKQAQGYLRDLTRVIRECGINVPLFNTNDLWQEIPGTIDTWRGRDDLFVQLRQLRTIQPDMPRLLAALDASNRPRWGASRREVEPTTPETLLRQTAQCLAAGAQPIVSPFSAGTYFGFGAGRLPGGREGFLTTTAAASAPVGEGGTRGERYHQLRRLVSFANHFSHVFADLDPDYQPVALDLDDPQDRAGAPTVVSQWGPQGGVVFLFRAPGDTKPRSSSIVLNNGLRLPVPLGKQAVSWLVLDADLNGSGRLDYTNVTPFAIVNRTMLVLYGPKNAEAVFSINGTPMGGRIPSGVKPNVVVHKGLTVVLCHEDQIDSLQADRSSVYFGVQGFDRDGLPVRAEGPTTRPWIVGPDGRLRALRTEELAPSPSRTRRPRKTLSLKSWQAAPADAHVEGTSPRYATLGGPATLMSCGASVGYGWYRVRLKSASRGKLQLALPEAADRVHLFQNGESLGVFGEGPHAHLGSFEASLAGGESTLTALVENFGRFSDGNELNLPSGWYGHLQELKPLRTSKPKIEDREPIDPFTLRGYLFGCAKGQLSERGQVVWSFTHRKKSPILLEVDGVSGTGTFLLNDQPIAYYPGLTGRGGMTLLLGSERQEAFKRGQNELRFAPDDGWPEAAEEMRGAATLHECAEEVTGAGSWSFARWEPPQTESFLTISKAAAKACRGRPCWWRTTFALAPEKFIPPAWLETRGLSKGQVLFNGHAVGRYFTAGPNGKAVGPQTRLYLPQSWFRADGHNELLIFDEHGFDPGRARLIFNQPGELD